MNKPSEQGSPQRKLEQFKLLGESVSLGLSNLGEVLGTTYTCGFAAIGALLSGRIFNAYLAWCAYVIALREGTPEPRKRFEQVLALPREKAIVLPSILPLMLAGGLVGIGMAIVLMIGLPIFGLLSFFSSILLPLFFVVAVFWGAMMLMFRIQARYVLGAIAAAKCAAPGSTFDESMVKQVIEPLLWPWSVLCATALLFGSMGMILCCIGSIVTVPLFALAMYLGAVDAIGLTTEDIDRFL
jgi:hypothetical protein